MSRKQPAIEVIVSAANEYIISTRYLPRQAELDGGLTGRSRTGRNPPDERSRSDESANHNDKVLSRIRRDVEICVEVREVILVAAFEEIK